MGSSATAATVCSEHSHAGAIDCRQIEVLTLLPKTINYPHVAQVFRVRRERWS